MREAEPYSIIRNNERMKLASSILANLATALIAAAAYRVFVEVKADAVALLWIIVITALISAANGLLGLLEPEA